MSAALCGQPKPATWVPGSADKGSPADRRFAVQRVAAILPMAPPERGPARTFNWAIYLVCVTAHNAGRAQCPASWKINWRHVRVLRLGTCTDRWSVLTRRLGTSAVALAMKAGSEQGHTTETLPVSGHGGMPHDPLVTRAKSWKLARSAPLDAAQRLTNSAICLSASSTGIASAPQPAPRIKPKYVFGLIHSAA